VHRPTLPRSNRPQASTPAPISVNEGSALVAAFIRILVTTALALSGLTAVAVAAAPTAGASACTYQVIEEAQVRETPSINSVVRKTKPVGSIVGGPLPCYGQWGTDGRLWIAVDCTCATDGIGWIIAYKLYKLTPV
jgi:hypothetical protein